MGIKLMVEVFDYAPEDLPAPEKLLLLALAEKSNDETREVIWPRNSEPRKILQRRCGVSESGLSKIFCRLAKRGLDPRVPIASDKQGRPVFAFEKTNTTYRMPVLRRDLLGMPMDAENPPEWVGSVATHSGEYTNPDGRPPEPEYPPDQVALVPLSLRSPDARVSAAAAHLVTIHGSALDHDDALAIAGVVASSKPNVTNLAAYLGKFPLADLLKHRPRRPAGAAKTTGPRCTVCGFDQADCTRRAAINEHSFTPPSAAGPADTGAATLVAAPGERNPQPEVARR